MGLNVPDNCLAAKILKRSRVSDFTLTEALYPAGLTLSKHSHEGASFSFVLKGGYTETYGNKIRHCEPSKVIYLPSGETHSDNFLSVGARALHVEIDLRRQMRFGELTTLLADSTDFQGGIIASLFYQLYREFGAKTDGATPLAIEGLILEIIAASLRQTAEKRTKNERVKDVERARDFLHAHFSEQNSLARIAALSGMQPTYLARAFRRRYGYTVGEYVRRLRIEFACRELSDSEKPLALIAQNAGFFDQSHFSNTFKRLTGQSPAAYRKLLCHD
jgi:AraC family transcriptional regulator